MSIFTSKNENMFLVSIALMGCPITFVVHCPQLSLSFGLILYHNARHLDGTDVYVVNSVADFTCNHGYRIEGSNTTTCQQSGMWDQETPTCIQGELILIAILPITCTSKLYRTLCSKSVNCA